MAITGRLSSPKERQGPPIFEEYCDLVVKAGLEGKLEVLRASLWKKDAPVSYSKGVRTHALSHAVTLNDVKLMRWLLKLDDDTRMDPFRLANLLKHAIVLEKEQVAVYFLRETRARMSREHSYEFIRLAAASGMVKVVDYFIKCDGIDHRKLDGNGWDLACHAVYKGQIGMLTYLIETGILYDVGRSYGENGRQLLHIAALNGQLEAVKWLVEEAKADIFAVDEGGKTAEMCAMSINSHDIVDYLVGKRLELPPPKVCMQSLSQFL